VTFWQLLPALRAKSTDRSESSDELFAAMTGWGEAKLRAARAVLPTKGTACDPATSVRSVPGQLRGSTGTDGVGDSVTVIERSVSGTENGFCRLMGRASGTPGVRSLSLPEIVNAIEETRTGGGRSCRDWEMESKKTPPPTNAATTRSEKIEEQ
jgi:hypothetical protein